MSAFTLKLIQIGFLVLLWLMVLSVAAVMRSDMFARRRNRPPKQPKPPKAPKRATKQAPKPATTASTGTAAATQPTTPAGALFAAGSGTAGVGSAGTAAAAGGGAAAAAAAGIAGALADQAPASAEGATAAGVTADSGRNAKPPKPKRGAPRNLVIVSGVGQGTAVELGATPISIGRSPGNTLVLEDDYVSGRHARLYPHEGAWVVEDLGSTNGTYLDRARLTAPVVLPVGTPVRIGKSVLELRK